MSGPQCCANPPTLDPSAGAGHVLQLGGLSTYVAGSPNSKLAVLIISDIFGYEAPNLRKVADKVAAAGFYAVVPDFIHGDPYAFDKPDRPLPVWLKDHGTDKGFEEAKTVIEALKSHGVSAVGAAGYCWGAKVTIELGKCELIQAGVLLHPAWVTVDDTREVKVPTAILGAEIDDFAPPELLKQFEEVLNAKSGVDSLVKVFPKVEHGWTIRYNAEDEAAVKSAEEANQILLDWCVKHVK
ncbi:endo-1,3;1,4-beta-D-glucanase-like [Alnus glutinosa]|uniref:endo-1,3;1,4-beta-D-glucanase-like n=1 Tax=Alnus glutinosa TaxID=3517 RepID=UPI002D77C1E0|nr:endo-1,3;1,4-beta-D-glucanase-like [Alnus glutinosa]